MLIESATVPFFIPTGAKRSGGICSSLRHYLMLIESATVPFVIPTGAKRSGGICSSADPSWKCSSTERSAVEGPARFLLPSRNCVLRSTSPNLLPGSIMTNSSQKHVDTHNNNKTNNHKQANSDQKNAEHIHVAACDCQHTGHSLTAANTLAKHHRRRLRRGPKAHPKVRKSSRFALSFTGHRQAEIPPRASYQPAQRDEQDARAGHPVE